MAGNSSVTPHSVMEKYEFYFLGLTFTLLGASIQTAEFATYSSASVGAEIIGWAGFTLSGLVGLSKIEYLGVLIYLRNRKDKFEKYKSDLEQAKALGTTSARVAQTGENMAVDEVILRVDTNLSHYAAHLEKVGRWHSAKHLTQKWSFFLGLISVAMARAYDAVVPIIHG